MSSDRSSPFGLDSETSSALPPLFRQVQLWTLLFFAASVCFHLVEALALHHHAHSIYPYSLNSHDRFSDFSIFIEKFRVIHSSRFFEVGFPINYPAPVALIFNLFFRYAAPHPVRAFVVFCVLSFIIPAILFGRALVRRGILPTRAYSFTLILCVFSWPVDLIVDGANAEVLVWLAMAAAMFFLAKDRGYSAAIFFGVAAALKLFPFVFLALFLYRREFGKFLTGVVSFVLLSIVSLKLLGPSIVVAYRGISFGLTQFKRNYMACWRPGENGVDHSIFAAIKLLLVYGFHHDRTDFTGWLRVYLLLTGVGGVLLYFLVIRKTPLLNQVLLLSVASIYFTAFSGDGTLIHLYYPLAMLLFLALAAWKQGLVVPGLQAALGCIVFCVSIESFFVVSRGLDSVRYIGLMHAIGLGVLFLVGLRYPFGPPVANGLRPQILAHPDLTWLNTPSKQPAPPHSDISL